MSIGAILTLGLGVFGSVNLLPTLGYGANVAPTVVDVSATPGRIYRDFADRERYIRKVDDSERQIEPTLVVRDAQADEREQQYAKESLRLAAAVGLARQEAESARAEIAKLEAAAEERRQSEIIAKKLLIARQALIKAQIQEAVLIEEMEIIDIAYIAMTAFLALEAYDVVFQ